VTVLTVFFVGGSLPEMSQNSGCCCIRTVSHRGDNFWLVIVGVVCARTRVRVCVRVYARARARAHTHTHTLCTVKALQNYNFACCLYGCETWSPTLQQECRLRVLENRALWKISGPMRDKVTGEWRRLHKEMYNLQPPPNNIWVIKSRRMRWAGHVVPMRTRWGTFRGSVRKPEGKSPFGRPSIDESIVLGWEVVDWIYLTEGRDKWIMNLWVP
jgi:hypothetical protein